MRAFIIVVINPSVQIGLQLVGLAIDFLPGGHFVELFLDCPVEPLTDAIGLWAVGLSPRMIDVVDRQIQLVIMPAAKLGATIGQNPQ